MEDAVFDLEALAAFPFSQGHDVSRLLCHEIIKQSPPLSLPYQLCSPLAIVNSFNNASDVFQDSFGLALSIPYSPAPDWGDHDDDDLVARSSWGSVCSESECESCPGTSGSRLVHPTDGKPTHAAVEKDIQQTLRNTEFVTGEGPVEDHFREALPQVPPEEHQHSKPAHDIPSSAPKSFQGPQAVDKRARSGSTEVLTKPQASERKKKQKDRGEGVGRMRGTTVTLDPVILKAVNSLLASMDQPFISNFADQGEAARVVPLKQEQGVGRGKEKDIDDANDGDEASSASLSPFPPSSNKIRNTLLPTSNDTNNTDNTRYDEKQQVENLLKELKASLQEQQKKLSDTLEHYSAIGVLPAGNELSLLNQETSSHLYSIYLRAETHAHALLGNQVPRAPTQEEEEEEEETGLRDSEAHDDKPLHDGNIGRPSASRRGGNACKTETDAREILENQVPKVAKVATQQEEEGEEEDFCDDTEAHEKLLHDANIGRPRRSGSRSGDDAGLNNNDTKQVTKAGAAAAADRQRSGSRGRRGRKLKVRVTRRQQGMSGARGQLPQAAAAHMLAWLRDHWNDPKPTREQKLQMVATCGIEMKQVNDWFVNARARIWKPITEQLIHELNKDN